MYLCPLKQPYLKQVPKYWASRIIKEQNRLKSQPGHLPNGAVPVRAGSQNLPLYREGCKKSQQGREKVEEGDSQRC
jgi:hypothetical protein